TPPFSLTARTAASRLDIAALILAPIPGTIRPLGDGDRFAAGGDVHRALRRVPRTRPPDASPAIRTPRGEMGMRIRRRSFALAATLLVAVGASIGAVRL